MAKATLSAMWDRVEPVLAPVLTSPEANDRLRAAAARLPSVPFALFECRLGVRPRRVDLSIGGPARAVGGGTLIDLTGLRALIEAGIVETVLLEYDLDASSREPAVFAGFAAGVPLGAALVLSLAAVLRRAPSAAQSAALRRCASAQSEDVRVTHLGVMRGRASCPLRVNARSHDVDALRRCAVRLGLRAPQLAMLERLLADLEPFACGLVLAVDLADEPLPRFGIECYPGTARDEGSWAAFLAYLVATGQCTFPECDALASWPGSSAANGTVDLTRSLNHVKLVVEPGAPLHAKAYLAASRR